MNLCELNYRQYKHFVDNKNPVSSKIIEICPESEILFKKSAETIDPDLFCHELGHALEIVRKKQHHRLLLSNFGFGEFRNNSWTEKMGDNEAKVFAQQELLFDLFGVKNSFLGPSSAGCFISVCVGGTAKSGYYENLILSYKEELRDQYYQLFIEFIDYMVKYAKVN